MQIDDGIRHPAERFPKKAIPFASRSDLTHTAFVAEQTMAYVERMGAAPFFCISGFYSPHSPWVAPQEFIDLYDLETLSLPRFATARSGTWSPSRSPIATDLGSYPAR